MRELSKGDVVHNFEVVSVADLPEYRSKGILLKHRRTGCEVYHVVNDDEENLFAFAFKTVPHDNTGVAHILEHSVLCGSKRFPVKDPFLVLLKSSLNTFLNAFTFPDKTVYPASSTVEKDYFNLMKVYGDAVFFPLLREEAFMQEGHRLEVNADGKLELTGIVYNEMKGNYSDQDSIVAEWAYRTLFPASPYRYDSGGEPEEIPQLTYADFKNFHSSYYHPSNCRIFLYGDIPTEKQLEFLDAEFLSSFQERGKFVPRIDLQKRIDRPMSLEKGYPLGADESTEGKTSITVSWLMAPVTDSLLLLSFEVLTEMLLGNAGSPLEKVLVDSGLGEDVSPASGLETELREVVFTAGLRGTDPDRKQAIEELMLEEFRRIVREGFAPDVKEAAMRKVEFRNREIRGGGPYGLRLMRKTLRGWLHGETPEMTLEFSRWMETLRTRSRDYPMYFENLVKTYLVENNHRSTVVVKPDPGLQKREEDRLKKALSKRRTGMSEGELSGIREKNDRLRRFQEEPDSPEARNTIPFLSLSDVPKEVEVIPYRKIELGGVPVYAHDLFTNGIVYIDFAFDLSGLTEEELKLLPFMSDAVVGLGLPGTPYDEVARKLDLITGGFGSSLDVSPLADNPANIRKVLYYRLKALESMVPEALELATSLLLSADFSDTNRLKDLFLEDRNDMRSSVIPSGHSYAILRALSRFSPSHRIEELWKGISQIMYLAEFSPEKDSGTIGEKCRMLRKKVFTRSALTLGLTCSGEFAGKAGETVRTFLERFPVRPADGTARPDQETVPAGPKMEALIAPASVSFAATAFAASRLGTPENAHEVLLAHFLKTGFLWERIRMKGGAYGAFASSSGLEGTFSLGSYRDPNIAATFAAFRESLEFLAKEGVEAETVERTIIGAVGAEIHPLSPGEKGAINLKRRLYGVTDEVRQVKRSAMLAAGGEDLVRASARLLAAFDDAYSAVVCSRDACTAASTGLPALKDAMTIIPL